MIFIYLRYEKEARKKREKWQLSPRTNKTPSLRGLHFKGVIVHVTVTVSALQSHGLESHSVSFLRNLLFSLHFHLYKKTQTETSELVVNNAF